MTSNLRNKQIIVGVTGGIAAYKSADLIRRLREQGASVRVVMTENAKRFITPLTLQAVSGYPVHDNLFDVAGEAAMGHIELARWADVIIVAPASADFIARLANGMANDLLTTICIASQAPIAIAPAMNQCMWKNSVTQANLQALQSRDIQILGPVAGSQACGEVGPGRMIEPISIAEKMGAYFATGILSGRRVLITAGPTREAIDPVRFISNASSGKMGYALADAAREAGAEVTLISGPVNLAKPYAVTCISVNSAAEMYAAVMQQVQGQDIFFGVAAVADYRCQHIADQKIPKQQAERCLLLERNPDIIAEVARLSQKPYVVGFAAETHDVLIHAKAKLIAKNLDMIIANQVGNGIGFDSDENTVVLIEKEEQHALAKMEKSKLARKIVELVAKKLGSIDNLNCQ